MHAYARWAGVAAATAITLGLHFATAPAALGVDTAMAISTTAINFGQVNVGSTAQASVTLTNTGGTAFGPINIFGGAPPTAEFNASQNCQGTTLPAGGSCMVNYSFSPAANGSFNDTSSFTISKTNSQADGEDFSVALAGVGVGGTATTTTTTTTRPATTTTRPATTTTRATTTTTRSGGGGGSGGGGTGTGTGAPTTVAPLGASRAIIAHADIAPGDDQSATANGFKPNELVSAVMQPGGVDLGSRVADAAGTVRFTWTIADTEEPGAHEFVATGTESGTASATFVVATPDSDSGTSPALLAAMAAIALVLLAGAGYLVYRNRHAGGPDTPPA